MSDFRGGNIQDTLQDENTALRAEVERLRPKCDLLSASWKSAEEEIAALRARLEAAREENARLREAIVDFWDAYDRRDEFHEPNFTHPAWARYTTAHKRLREIGENATRRALRDGEAETATGTAGLPYVFKTPPADAPPQREACDNCGCKRCLSDGLARCCCGADLSRGRTEDTEDTER